MSFNHYYRKEGEDVATSTIGRVCLYYKYFWNFFIAKWSNNIGFMIFRSQETQDAFVSFVRLYFMNKLLTFLLKKS